MRAAAVRMMMGLMALGALTAEQAEAAPTAYVLGDSYTVKASDAAFLKGRTTMAQRLTSAGFSAVVRGRGGRNVRYAIPSPNGLQQVSSDRLLIGRMPARSVMVVPLGTNLGDGYGPTFGDAIRVLVGRVRSYGFTGPIVWVDPYNFVADPTAQRKLADRRSWMSTNASRIGIASTVHWSAQAALHREWFQADTSHKHPDAVGTSVFIDLIVHAVQAAS